MKKVLKVGDIVYSNSGVGVVMKCYEGFFGDSETVYEVNYFENGCKVNRIKDFNECI